jgi:transposase
VTLALLHVEYVTEHPDGLRYTAFCERYREWLKRHSPVMRQVHPAGDKLFVDYSGMRAQLVHPLTGEVTDVELFVAVLGASNYTFAEATRTQQVGDFVASVSRALTFIGGVPCAIVPDQLKSAVIKACRYDPAVQRTTAELGRFYNTTILRERRHPEWGFRSCLGLFRLAKKYDEARVEAACKRALFAGARSYRHVLTILQHNLDQQPLPVAEAPAAAGATHENVRGPGYYH